MFYAPSAFDELDRQPIEQRGMRRLLAARTEIFRRRDQPRADILLPDAVDDHARRQRIVFVHDPFRQTQTVWRRVFREGMKRGWGSRRDDVGWPLPIAAPENSSLTGQTARRQRQGRWPVRPI